MIRNLQIHLVQSEILRQKQLKRYDGYDICGYAILVEIETGMRIAELCALKWEDVLFNRNVIHIHSQQLRDRGTDGKNYRYVDYTKDEKGVSRGGRYYPITDTLHELFSELLSLQKKLQIKSEYVFCRRDGQWLKATSYESSLRRLMVSLGLNVTNNHAFRLLGHSVIIPFSAKKESPEPTKIQDFL